MSVCMHLYTYTTYKPATLVVMRMLGTKHRSSAKQQVFLTTKPSLQPQSVKHFNFKTSKYIGLHM